MTAHRKCVTLCKVLFWLRLGSSALATPDGEQKKRSLSHSLLSKHYYCHPPSSSSMHRVCTVCASAARVLGFFYLRPCAAVLSHGYTFTLGEENGEREERGRERREGERRERRFSPSRILSYLFPLHRSFWWMCRQLECDFYRNS